MPETEGAAMSGNHRSVEAGFSIRDMGWGAPTCADSDDGQRPLWVLSAFLTAPSFHRA